MNAIKVALILFFPCAFLLNASQKKTNDRSIIITIPPFDSGNENNLFPSSSCIAGFCNETNKVHLLSNDENFFKNKTEGVVIPDVVRVGSEIGDVYTRERWAQALRERTTTIYPLCWHKRVEHLTGAEKLRIYKGNNQAENTVYELVISSVVSENIVRYLCNDVLNEKATAFDFCYEISLRHVESDVEATNLLEPYLIEINPLEELLAGYVVGIGSLCNENKEILFKHYCFALGDGAYMFKCGSKGPLCISDMKYLLASYTSSLYVKIKAGMTKVASFFENPFTYTMPLHTITMSIRTNEDTTETGFFPVLVRGIGNMCVNVKNEPIPFNCEGPYYLHKHKKLLYAKGNERFAMEVVQKDGTTYFLPELSHTMQTKLLLYLMRDSETWSEHDMNNCLYFCSQLCFNFYKESDRLDSFVSFAHRCEYVSEEQLSSGDAIALFTYEGREAKELRHYAITLGNGFYLAKNGCGGYYSITNMDFMLRTWKCDGFVKINKNVSRYSSFLENCLGKRYAF